MDKEKEKARLKKLQKEQAQKEKADAKVEEQHRRREEAEADIASTVARSMALAVAEAPASTDEPSVREKIAKLSAPALPEALPAPAADGAGGGGALGSRAPRQRRAGAVGKLGEEAVRKLFDLMDRNGKSQVSRRDVLVALRKQPSVRELYGVPQGGQAGATLEARLAAIQDAFEGGSTLGDLEPLFAEMAAAGSPGGAVGAQATFGFEAFLTACHRQPFMAHARSAAALLPREHVTSSSFVATSDWAEVPEGAACPAGLEYKMDMESGRTMARLPPARK